MSQCARACGRVRTYLARPLFEKIHVHLGPVPGQHVGAGAEHGMGWKW